MAAAEWSTECNLLPGSPGACSRDSPAFNFGPSATLLVGILCKLVHFSRCKAGGRRDGHGPLTGNVGCSGRKAMPMTHIRSLILAGISVVCLSFQRWNCLSHETYKDAQAKVANHTLSTEMSFTQLPTCLQWECHDQKAPLLGIGVAHARSIDYGPCRASLYARVPGVALGRCCGAWQDAPVAGEWRRRGPSPKTFRVVPL